MIQHGLRIAAQLKPWGRSVALLIGRYDAGVFSVAKPVEFVKTDENDAYDVEPALSLPMESAQQLMDELWRCGLRPSEGSGSSGSLAATERHLGDMRALAFGKLGIAAPGVGR